MNSNLYFQRKIIGRILKEKNNDKRRGFFSPKCAKQIIIHKFKSNFRLILVPYIAERVHKLLTLRVKELAKHDQL